MKTIYALRTNSMSNPIGLDLPPKFSWKMKSDEYNVIQTAYRIEISENSDFSDIIYDSGKVISQKSVDIACDGAPLKPSTEYFWRASVWCGAQKLVSETAHFETGLMKCTKDVWDGAKWIGSPVKTVNPAGVCEYKITVQCNVPDNAAVGIVFSARDRDNYILAQLDGAKKRLTVYEYCDNAWDGEYAEESVRVLGNPDGYEMPPFSPDDCKIEITVIRDTLCICKDGHTLIDSERIMPKIAPFKPQKGMLYNWGFKQTKGRVIYKSASVSVRTDGEWRTIKQYDFSENTAEVLGEPVQNAIAAENAFNIVSPAPAANVCKAFTVRKPLKRARLYASARGFYDAYINGTKVNSDFYNPGFTDYRKRIQYQTYDVTDLLKIGKNSVCAVVAKGYYTGHVGYSPSMIYGESTAFIAKLFVEYADGTSENTVTDGTWLFEDRGAVMDADFIHGERCDARLELDMSTLPDVCRSACGVYEQDEYASATNGVIENEPFVLSAQSAQTAQIERILHPVNISEMPSGHFVYDMGQNMVGTVRIKLMGERAKAIKIRYGEMCYKSGAVYISNLRSAYNTDVYVPKGDKDGEVFVPSFTAHGFRYVEITGEGYTLTKEDIGNMDIRVEGLVITNTSEVTGRFECSNALVNKLQQNIQWGQRSNSLLVFTDCPQRNERMGWTGDAQVFAKTAAYNMNVRAFMDKWLLDLRDAQLLYNKDGAVPDTAPLGGDNRPSGCGGWGDAAVIVPWQMYLSYGDEHILEQNYDMMAKWVDYQSRPDRQNFGLRTVGGVEMTAESDLAQIPFIQVQQSRGDHLSFDVSTPYILSATAYAAHSAHIMSKTAEILGKTYDAEKYRTRFENIKRAFCEAWVCEDGSIAYWGEMSGKTPQGKEPAALDGSVPYKTYYSDLSGSVHHPSQTAYALALDFDLIPPEKRARAVQCYKDAIERNNNRLSAGFLGISHLAPSLTKSGLGSTAYRLLEQEEFPSWLYSVKNGATTIWERWNSYIAETDTFGDVSMNSFNHYAYGAIGEWLFDTVLGINTSEKRAQTGYKHIILKPCIGGSLTWAKGCYDSVYGNIVSEWDIADGKGIYRCEIPANTTAEIYLPTDKAYSVRVKECGGELPDGQSVYNVGSGKYTFEFEV